MERILDLELLKIKDSIEDYTYFGGNQEWFETKWRRMSGCGPTTASTIIMYEDIKNNIDKFQHYSKSEFLVLMNDVWEFITPQIGRGVNTIELFLEGFEKYINSRQHKNIKSNFLKIPKKVEERPSNKEVFKFLDEALEKGHPIAFLNLDNGKEKNLDAWHWVTVVGVLYCNLDDKLEITICDEGILKKINLSLWIETTKNEGGFVYFV